MITTNPNDPAALRMGHRHQIEWFDRVINDQLTPYKDWGEANEHANAMKGWIEYLERVEEADLEIRWWTYRGAGLGEGEKAPLVVLLYEYYNTAWQHVADAEGLNLVAFEYHRNQRNPEGGLGALGFGPKDDEIVGYHAVVERVAEEFCVDRARIYIVGLSYGDMSSMFYVHRYPGTIAGIASVNGPSSPYNLNRYGVFEGMPATPSIQFRSDDDLTCDGFPAGISFEIEGNEEWLRNIRSKQVLVNRNVWMKANGATVRDPQIKTDGYRAFVRYTDGAADVIFAELNRHSHMTPVDNAQLIWDNLFSRYALDGSGRPVCIDPAWDADEGAIAVVAGLDAAYVDNKVVRLPAPVCVVEPHEELIADAVFYAKTECSYATAYAPVEILKLGFGLDYTYTPAVETHSRVYFGAMDDAIALEDGVIAFECNGSSYELLTNTPIAKRDGKVTDLERPPLTIDGHLMVPIAEVARLLGRFASERNDVVYVSDKPFELGHTLTRMLREEILAAELIEPRYAATLLPVENGTVGLSAAELAEGETLVVTVASAEGFAVAGVTATMNGVGTVVNKMADDTYWVCNAYGDIEVKADFAAL